MFDSVLVANRGEIACRVIRTAKRLGMRTVALYCHEDRKARHVAMADEAVEIEGATPSAAYLDIGSIVAIAQDRKVAAVHPGYGFLSENAGFAAAVEAAGLVFVGPSPAAIDLMGDKVRSRDFAASAGVPVSRAVTHEGDLGSFVEQASELGFPLLVKASAGGGGKGMSIVRSRAELEARAGIAISEAERYFGSGRIYAERYIERPRHIEVQVFGDGDGGAIHLGERECSIQRRFQKVVEESPAANIDAELRERICAAAVDLARRSGYRNAGTVEFILAPSGEFFFLEMNTRLQVEHPVTEMVTGLDLVELQFRIAAGQGIGLSQAEVSSAGHAIEVRLCAEEPENNFAPAIGKVSLLVEPPVELARFDTGLSQGQVVTPSFDSMLAKIIVHGNSRDQAIERLRQAIDATAILGVETNLDFLGRVVGHPAFGEGALHTGFLTEHADSLAPETRPFEVAAAAVVAAFGIAEFRASAADRPDVYGRIGGWRN